VTTGRRQQDACDHCDGKEWGGGAKREGKGKGEDERDGCLRWPIDGCLMLSAIWW
jgi:hypothetical protein